MSENFWFRILKEEFEQKWFYIGPLVSFPKRVRYDNIIALLESFINRILFTGELNIEFSAYSVHFSV